MNPKKPRILLTNDDGIEAASIWELKRVLSPHADCEIVAPRHPRSASSHAVSLTSHIRVHRMRREGGVTGFGVEGTPADAIKIALCELFRKEPFDLIISGINLGLNTGVSVYYSGTIAAAREGVIAGIPGFAVSIDAFEWNGFGHALDLTRDIAGRYLANEFPKDYFLNVNIPGVEAGKIKGIRLTRQAPSKFVESYEREDREGEPHYRLKGEIVVIGQNGDTDQEALDENFVSITPLILDMTHYPYMEKTRSLVDWLKSSKFQKIKEA